MSGRGFSLERFLQLMALEAALEEQDPGEQAGERAAEPLPVPGETDRRDETREARADEENAGDPGDAGAERETVFYEVPEVETKSREPEEEVPVEPILTRAEERAAEEPLLFRLAAEEQPLSWGIALPREREPEENRPAPEEDRSPATAAERVSSLSAADGEIPAGNETARRSYRDWERRWEREGRRYDSGFPLF